MGRNETGMMMGRNEPIFQERTKQAWPIEPCRMRWR